MNTRIKEMIAHRTVVRSLAPGPLVRTSFGPTTADLFAMIRDGRLTLDSETPDGKKVYALDRVRLGMEAPPAPPTYTMPPPLRTVPEDDAEEVKVIKKKPTALDKKLKGLTTKNKKFARAA